MRHPSDTVSEVQRPRRLQGAPSVGALKLWHATRERAPPVASACSKNGTILCFPKAASSRSWWNTIFLRAGGI
eukprot:2178587-Pleurochrysis_carterae.AAC.1